MPEAPPAMLSPAERRTLAYLAHGLTTEQIAVRVERSPTTVAGYRRTAYRRLGCGTGAAAVHRAYTLALIPFTPKVGYLQDVRLSPREWECLIGMALDLPPAALALSMGVTTATLRTHRVRLYQRLGARSAAHAVGIGHRSGLITHCPTCKARRVLEDLELDWNTAEGVTTCPVPQQS